MDVDYGEEMTFYICCKQENNNCPIKEECRRYLNANIGESWNLFKHVCTEDNNYQLFMEREDAGIVVFENEENKEIDERDS